MDISNQRKVNAILDAWLDFIELEDFSSAQVNEVDCKGVRLGRKRSRPSHNASSTMNRPAASPQQSIGSTGAGWLTKV